jgi:Kdo2-lipid IVA lauroyltransferase/acyltransferase
VKPLRKRIRWRIVALVALAFIGFLRILPLPLSRAFARTLARGVCRIVPGVHAITLKNLDLAFGDSLTPAEKRRIAREVYENIGTVAAEFPRIGQTQHAHERSWFRAEGIENVADPARGMLFVSGHMANWEWLAPCMSPLGKPIQEVVRPLDDPWLDAYVDNTRRSGNIGTIKRKNAGRAILDALAQGDAVGILIDQIPRDNAVPITFFGQRCWATAGPATVAVRAKCPLHVVTSAREPDGSYTLRLSPEIPVEKTGDLRADLVRITQACYDVLEAHIRRYPGQWLWLHDRWKPRPHFEENWARRTQR